MSTGIKIIFLLKRVALLNFTATKFFSNLGPKLALIALSPL